MDFTSVLDVLKNLIVGGAAARAGQKALKLAFRTPPMKTIPPCHWAPVHKGAGFTFNKQVVVHCSKEGQFHIRSL
jgi:hypothetical protein